MDVLKRLASDVADAGREAAARSEDETEACLAVLDEFCGEYEATDVRMNSVIPGVMRLAGDCPAEDYGPLVAVFVPRKQPSLLEATERASAAWHQSVMTTPAMTDAMLELDAAIQRARGGDE